MTSITWTAEQANILESNARINLVRAGPGSGKTTVFVEFIDRYLKSWNQRRGGVAALSFTNAAAGELMRGLGGTLPAPHFLGTLDSFFLRFVVRPFGHLVGLRRSGARLIPSPLDDQIRTPALEGRTLDGKPISIPLFSISVSGADELTPALQRRLPHGRGFERLPPDQTDLALRMKQREWATTGRMTHSDCQYMAAAIMRGQFGHSIAMLVARKFPVMLVDEFQDTGHFLSRALLCVLGLSEPSVSGLLVGDSDQRIFGFSGVDTDLFERAQALRGCSAHPMRTTQRCCARVSAVATMLARSEAAVVPRSGADAGAAILLEHRDEGGQISSHSLRKGAELARTHGCRTLAVLVRWRRDKRALLGLDASSEPPLTSRGARSLHRAIRNLVDGHGDRAARIVEGLLGGLVLDNDSPTQEDLIERQIDPRSFRRHARRLMLDLVRSTTNETWGQWTARIKSSFGEVAHKLGANHFQARLGSMFQVRPSSKRDIPRPASVASPSDWRHDLNVSFLTIHEAKGRQFDAVLVYWAKPSNSRVHESDCPSVAWWSTTPGSEEREVAFVAVSRARKLLVLSIHSESFEALKVAQPEFFGLFDRRPLVPTLF